mmetsp:Transcript_23978/g.37043  ORF Transcript_23978/g.37043 Transcript_23978/m.37043 type:complete len:151 (-) Transcript_23978:151-603(-)|eukprot:CAMPEP_0195299904 /NCGR_PEP_ID=MMETSP0707-20130614/26410_1 /TAXON_ID=33640 /ORGANISM="Asterionellopsis glacialis, Strain CCMP134" /LENGTH=150 /DNA_ID=CAMNT_0040362431 /DNA_START=117 /DNA_END=569 /DNA_ORIENTATION=-
MTNSSSSEQQQQKRPLTMADIDDRSNTAWMYSFGAAMVPFTAFVYGHSRGMTGRIVERVVKSPVGVYGLFALPFVSLGMEKSIYDTVQAIQGIDPQVVPQDRGGFPSGGGNLPSFSLVPVQKRLIRRLTAAATTTTTTTNASTTTTATTE